MTLQILKKSSKLQTEVANQPNTFLGKEAIGYFVNKKSVEFKVPRYRQKQQTDHLYFVIEDLSWLSFQSFVCFLTSFFYLHQPGELHSNSGQQCVVMVMIKRKPFLPLKLGNLNFIFKISKRLVKMSGRIKRLNSQHQKCCLKC